MTNSKVRKELQEALTRHIELRDRAKAMLSRDNLSHRDFTTVQDCINLLETDIKNVSDKLNELREPTKLERVQEFLETLNCEGIDLAYFVDEFTDSFEDLRQNIEDGQGFDIEVIYYSRAIDYLRENDPSLWESMELANDMGFDCKSLNSELLASLLASQNARIEFENLEPEITEFFEDLGNE